MSEFRGNSTESLANVPIQDVSAKPKTEYICYCGGRKFEKLATIGYLKSGGFVPESVEFKCLGCGKVHTSDQVRAYFAKPN